MKKPPDTLATLRKAIDRLERADDAYRAAILAAVEEYGYAETARAAGISRQAVRQLALREADR
jgi:DNA-directed RNA polymerase specialized sigma24 family protein